MKILVTGATGYVGGRLTSRLLETEHEVRVMARDRRKLRTGPWADRVEIFEADVSVDDGRLRAALSGVDVAYYLIHSMYAGPDFERRDQESAERFGRAAKEAKVSHVIFLGGLMPDAQPGTVSRHLASRAEVGRTLARHVPVTEFRAGPIIGSGSASFEMVRYLTERLPIMIAPAWTRNRVQPIAIRDALAFLIAAVERGSSGVVDIGADVLTFQDMMRLYARVRGLTRRMIPVPVFAPGLAARWVGAFTPIPNTLAVPLVEGMTHPLLADTRRASERFPEIAPIPYREALQLALEKTDAEWVETRWSGAATERAPCELTDWAGLIRETRIRRVRAPAERTFAFVRSLGGEQGWLCWNWAWRLRGQFDRLIGGPGLRRGRRHPRELAVGEAVDFWRVEALEEPTLLRLRAEMKTPGRAWLQYEVRADPADDACCELVQSALFAPRGLGGALYWYLLYPLHRLIFTGMVDQIVKRVEAGGGQEAEADRPSAVNPA